MTLEMILVLVVVAVALGLFLAERLRVDLVALLVLLALALLGLVTPEEAVAGFSSPVVLAVCSIFVLSAGLNRAGVAGWLGRQILWFGGRGEVPLLLAIMVTAGLMSFFMNTIGIVALMLPVVMDVARRTGRAPSKLLMPLSYGALLGGLTTLFATLTNLLVSDALRNAGLRPFGLLDFMPVGLTAAVAGMIFVVIGVRRWLPERDLEREAGRGLRLEHAFDFRERRFVLRVPESSALAGMSLQEARLGAALGLQVMAIVRNGATSVSPGAEFVLRGGDRLIVQGAVDQLNALDEWQKLHLHPGASSESLTSSGIGFAQVTVSPGSPFVGLNLAWLGFRRQFAVTVLAIRRGLVVERQNLQQRSLREGDILLVCGPEDRLGALAEAPELKDYRRVTPASLQSDYRLDERMITLEVTPESHLVGHSLGQSRLGDALGFAVLAITREDQTIALPSREETLCAGDRLLAMGRADDLARLRAIGELERGANVSEDWSQMETEQHGWVEVVLAPRCTLVGRTLPQIKFRERFGLTVMGLWRRGESHTKELRELTLEFGDALLLHGPKDKLRLLASNSDFIVLTQAIQEAPRYDKAPWAALAMLVFLMPVMMGWLPIHLGALLGAVTMVLSRCVSMEDACKAIELKSVLLIAGMVPLGKALQETGAAIWLAEGLVSVTKPLGGLAVVAAIFLITSIGTTIMPAAAFVLLMAPIVLHTAAELALSPHALMMALALAAAGSFHSPIAHPANVMIMGPGGYRFSDYMKLGIPLSGVILLVTLIVLPWVWPLGDGR